MTVRITGRYLGNKKIELTHEPSGAVLLTDAPLDNQGEGKSFSPTDLMGASLGSCMLTVMAIYAEREGINLSGMHMSIDKEMAANPRRVSSLVASIHMPAGLTTVEREKLERIANTCPIHYSVSPDLKVQVEFAYDA